VAKAAIIIQIEEYVDIVTCELYKQNKTLL